MSLRDDILPSIDDIRAIPGQLGLHRFRVYRVTETWSSVNGREPRVGHGPKTTTEVLLSVGGENVHARQATEADAKHVLGNGELFYPGDWIVGPLTPAHVAGGYEPAGFDGTAGSATQIWYRIEGDVFPGGSAYFQAIKKSADAPFRITLYLRRVNATPK